jgi:hypothetical protein
VTSALAQLQQAMAQLTAARHQQMVDTCRVTRPAELPQTPELDGDGNPVIPDDVVVYEGPCTVSDPTTALLGGRTSDDQSGVPNQRIAKLPHDADLRPGDLLTVTVAVFSPGMAGDAFVIVGEEERSYATYRRYLLRGSSWLAGP